MTDLNMQDTIPTPVVTQRRAYALDALRGFAILAMVLSGTIEYKILPAWMYHAQEPPPTHTFNPSLAGLTWVDLVFPLFLFSMGAAIPLALSRRLAKGLTKGRIILSILKRGFLLGSFAIVLQHLRPQVIDPDTTQQTWWIALLGFLLLFLMFVRWPDSRLIGLCRAITFGAWCTTIILLAFLRYPDGGGFSVYRSDIILIVLTNTAVFGSIIWLFTCSNLLLRLGSLGLLLALRLSTTAHGWIAWLWAASGKPISPISWIFHFEYLQYLFLVIPGTIAGDLILAWMQTLITSDSNQSYWSKSRFYSIITFVFAICITLLIGLQARWVWQTTLVSAAICVAGYFLFVKPVTPTEKLLNSLYLWGVYWLSIGLLFEPYQGGIKKDSPTISYFFVTAGMALFILIAFTVMIDILNQQKWTKLLIDNGQNPMIAYVGFANLLWPILALTQLEPIIVEHTRTPIFGFLKGLVYTAIVALVVSFFTRMKLFWRT
ncbi:MAG: DUF5009 domain-containing protein [Chroococcidiopsidaceae cyanobacterium CP_BM_RX_35]|nr:DUF5009 domain-containing protein [Chroococcidiopsidaceae cyanobacterium CP_BM_RX_35]